MTLAMIGLPVRMLMRMPLSVLIMLNASAPCSTAARAGTVMSVTFGVSLTIIGLSVIGRSPVHKIGEGHRVGAHAHAAGGNVRAADVDFQHVCVGVGELFHDRRVIVIAMSGDIGDDERAAALSLGRSSAK